MAKQDRKRLTKTEYEKLYQTAYLLVVVQNYTQRVASDRLGVSEKTMSEWATKGDWDRIKKARQSATGTASENIRRIIELISERRLEIEEQIGYAQSAGDKEAELDLLKKAKGLSDEISKQNKTLQEIDKNSFTLGKYIDIMDDIFNNLQSYDEDLYNRTIQFQTYLIKKKTIELG